MKQIIDQLLLARLKAKNKNAATKLIDKNYQSIYIFLHRLCGNKETAQDLTQDTFIKAWKALDNFEGNCKLSTWLTKIAYNLYLDFRKMKTLQTTPIEQLDSNQFQIAEALLDEKVVDKDTYQRLSKEIGKLSTKLQEIIVLYYQEQLSYKEISIVLGIPKGTVKSRLNYAIKEMRNHVSKW